MYSPGIIFWSVSTHSSRPAEKLNLGKSIPFWMSSLDIISEPTRTKYSEEPELYRFLARTKTCCETRTGLSDWPLPNQKIVPRRTTMYSPGIIFWSVSTHSSRPAEKLNLGKSIPFWMSSLDIISEPTRTKYSEEPELYRFLARTKTCCEIGGIKNKLS